MIKQISDIYEISNDENFLMFRLHNKNAGIIDIETIYKTLNEALMERGIKAIVYDDMLSEPEKLNLEELKSIRDQLSKCIESIEMGVE